MDETALHGLRLMKRSAEGPLVELMQQAGVPPSAPSLPGVSGRVGLGRLGGAAALAAGIGGLASGIHSDDEHRSFGRSVLAGGAGLAGGTAGLFGGGALARHLGAASGSGKERAAALISALLGSYLGGSLTSASGPKTAAVVAGRPAVRGRRLTKRATDDPPYWDLPDDTGYSRPRLTDAERVQSGEARASSAVGAADRARTVAARFSAERVAADRARAALSPVDRWRSDEPYGWPGADKPINRGESPGRSALPAPAAPAKIRIGPASPSPAPAALARIIPAPASSAAPQGIQIKHDGSFETSSEAGVERVGPGKTRVTAGKALGNLSHGRIAAILAALGGVGGAASNILNSDDEHRNPGRAALGGAAGALGGLGGAIGGSHLAKHMEWGNKGQLAASIIPALLGSYLGGAVTSKSAAADTADRPPLEPRFSMSASDVEDEHSRRRKARLWRSLSGLLLGGIAGGGLGYAGGYGAGMLTRPPKIPVGKGLSGLLGILPELGRIVYPHAVGGVGAGLGAVGGGIAGSIAGEASGDKAWRHGLSGRRERVPEASAKKEEKKDKPEPKPETKTKKD